MNTGKKTILIVDDEELNRAILYEMLYQQYNILEAENGREAVEILEQDHSDIAIVLLDVIMPVMDGFQVLAAMGERGWMKEMPVVLITAESSESAAIKGYELGVSDIINKPFNPNIVIRRVENIIQLNLHQHHLEDMVQKQMSILEQQAQKIKQTSNFVIDVLSNVVEFRSGESGLHIKRIRNVTKLLMDALSSQHPEYELTEELIELVSSASALHDIGKIAIPDAVLNKPGKLTNEEYEIMKTHSIKGCEILQSIDYVQDEEYFKYCYNICRYHHERWNGEGYPDGLKGDEIPLYAQVVGVADVYDALTNERVYKPAYSHDKAVDMIIKGECGSFNPVLMECFLSIDPVIKTECAVSSSQSNFHEEPHIIHCDVSKEKTEKRRELASTRTLRLLELERQKYHILSEMSGEIIFDYDTRTDVLVYSEKYKEVFGRDIRLERAAASDGDSQGMISPEDYRNFKNLLDGLSIEHPMSKTEVQLQTLRDGWQWFEIYVTSLWDTEDSTVCNGYMGKLTSIHELKMETNRWKLAAERDALTGIYNRKSIQKIVEDYVKKTASNRQGALLFIDVDNFKRVNDTMGHLTGDSLLKQIAIRIRSLTRASDVVGRVGGDEFIVFLTDTLSKEGIIKCADKLCSAFWDIPIEYQGLHVSCSIGIAVYPTDALDYENLLKKADHALYSAKRKGKNQFAFYQDDLDGVEFASMLTELDENIEEQYRR